MHVHDAAPCLVLYCALLRSQIDITPMTSIVPRSPRLLLIIIEAVRPARWSQVIRKRFRTATVFLDIAFTHFLFITCTIAEYFEASPASRKHLTVHQDNYRPRKLL
jgi:hypothetical protein